MRLLPWEELLVKGEGARAALDLALRHQEDVDRPALGHARLIAVLDEVGGEAAADHVGLLAEPALGVEDRVVGVPLEVEVMGDDVGRPRQQLGDHGLVDLRAALADRQGQPGLTVRGRADLVGEVERARQVVDRLDLIRRPTEAQVLLDGRVGRQELLGDRVGVDRRLVGVMTVEDEQALRDQERRGRLGRALGGDRWRRDHADRRVRDKIGELDVEAAVLRHREGELLHAARLRAAARGVRRLARPRLGEHQRLDQRHLGGGVELDLEGHIAAGEAAAVAGGPDEALVLVLGVVADQVEEHPVRAAPGLVGLLRVDEGDDDGHRLGRHLAGDAARRGDADGDRDPLVEVRRLEIAPELDPGDLDRLKVLRSGRLLGVLPRLLVAGDEAQETRHAEQGARTTMFNFVDCTHISYSQLSPRSDVLSG